MSGASPRPWVSASEGVPPVNSLTLHSDNALPHNISDGNADVAAHPGVTTIGGSGGHHPGVAHFSSLHSHQTSIPDHVLNNPAQIDDAPYVPPRATEVYSALGPRADNVYALNHDVQQQYPYEGGTSPSESHHSVESTWSNSPSSTSSQQLPRDYLIDPTYAQATRHDPYSQHYPAYHAQQQPSFEHVRYADQPSHTDESYYRAAPENYPIDSLLSPEIFDDTSIHTTTPQATHPPTSCQTTSSSIPAANQHTSISTFHVSSTPLTNSTPSPFPDAGFYLRQQLALSPHEPVSLHSIPDPPPGEKPSTPLPMLIKLAIYGSPNKQLTLQEIYSELENRFDWFREHKKDRAWKNSIRHNLSLNKVFRHVPRPITEPGKGSYWTLDVSEGEGYKRARKRRPKNRIITSEEEEEEVSEMDEDRPNSLSISQRVGPSRSSAPPADDANIDPELRREGHVVGEGRARSTTRRADRESPYPSQSPRYQQGSLPAVASQDTNTLGQPSLRLFQPSFGQSSFPVYPHTRPMPATSSATSFATVSSTPMAMGLTTPTTAQPQMQQMPSYDRRAPILQLAPRPGIEYVIDPGGLPTARRVRAHAEYQEQSQGGAACSSSESLLSGSSQTWNDARSGS